MIDIESESFADCQEIGNNLGSAGYNSRDVRFIRDGITYIVTVATADYLNKVREFNALFPAGQGTDENLLVMGTGISDLGLICQELRQLPIEKIRPFLNPQIRNPK